MKDYDITIQYHLGKANVVTDALSQISEGTLAIMITPQPRQLRDLAEMQIEVHISCSSSIMSELNQVSVEFDLYGRIKKAQQEDSQIKKIQEKIQGGRT